MAGAVTIITTRGSRAQPATDSRYLLNASEIGYMLKEDCIAFTLQVNRIPEHGNHCIMELWYV